MRTWKPIAEPDDVDFVQDADGHLWQHCRDRNWTAVLAYQEAGLPRVGEQTWGSLLGNYGPLTEVEVDGD